MSILAVQAWLEDAELPVQSAQGIDVSDWQGAYDWGAQSGLSFGAFRLTQGLGGAGTASPDPQAAHNHAGIAAAGLARMAYHFMDPGEDGAAQARYFSAQYTALGLGPEDGMWLDNETAAGCSPAQVSAVAQAFMAQLRTLHPHQPMGVYTFISFAAGGYNAGLGEYPLWLAYPAATAPQPPPPWARWQMWQWGVRNGTDRDAFNGTAADMRSWLAGFAPPAPAAPGVPSLHVATGAQSLAAFAASVSRTPLECAWLTAQHQPQPGPAHQAYLGGILAGTVRDTAPMPAGMNIWG